MSLLDAAQSRQRLSDFGFAPDAVNALDGAALF
jgi:hypothetical protein